MDEQLYKEIIIEHWQNPHHYGELKKPDIDASDVNPLCGDEIRIMLHVQEGVIKDISFVGQGCAISKAAASLLTDEVIGKKVEEVKNLSAEEFLKTLGVVLTPARTKCALLGYSILKKAIK
jgi:nitrogen fixation NifU-like protein